MKKHIVKNGITYELRGEYYYPLFRLPENEDYPIGKYGNLRHDFLKQHRKGTYTTLLTEFMLQKHLHDIDEEARQMIEELTLRIVSVRGGNEELKASNPLRWVQEMRNAKAAAEEIVLREVVYR